MYVKGILHEFVPREKGKIISLALCLAVAGILTYLFTLYGYLPTKILKYLLLAGGLMPIAWEDWRERMIPNRWLFYLVCIRIVLFMVEVVCYPRAVVDNLFFSLGGAVISGMVMFVGYVLSRHQIGPGDVKLLALTGLYLGATLNYFVMIAALLMAAVYGGIRMVRKRSGIKDEIAFAPFITASVILLLALGF